MVHLAVPTSIHFHFAKGFLHPNTRIDVRLLGPCFKTGRLEPLRQRPRLDRGPRPRPPHDAGGYNAPREEPHPSDLYPTGKVDAGPTSIESTGGRPPMIDGSHGLMPNASLSTISRTV